MSKINLELFRSIYKIRRTEEQISKLYSEQEMRCPVHLSIGQEATAVGVCSALNKNDKIISTHRAHAHYLAKGGSLKKMISELYGKKNGCVNGLGGSMYLQDIKAGVVAAVPIVGSNIAIGAGVAFKSMFEKTSKDITIIFFGEGATEEGIFNESINFASIHDLPILFVCENNLYSVYTPLKDRQTKGRNLTKIVSSYGIQSYSMNGNDVTQVYTKSKKIINNIRKKRKPFFLELKTYRWLEHCGPNWDDHLNYRPRGELKKWIKNCPLKKIEKKIGLNKKKIKKIKDTIDKEIESSFKYAKKSPFPNKQIIKNFYREFKK
jgi:TPP-dependent pyruvate/acetoin dehydrogenase alpha subunit